MAEREEGLSILQQNPALLSALQGRLGQLIGKSSGYIESLPLAVKKRIRACENLQSEQLKLEAQFRQEVLELEKKYLTKYQPLFDKRSKIATGEYEPTEEECKQEDVQDTGVEGEDDVKGIPEFWLTIFKNSQYLEGMLGEDDEKALTKLKDVRFAYLDGNPGFKLEFEFEENEFFTNKVLTKSYFLEDDADSPYADVMFDHAEATPIEWKEGKNLTIKTEVKKQRNKKTNQMRVVKKSVPQQSFFNFFYPPQIPEDDEEEEDDDLNERVQEDYEIGEHLKDQVIPRAIDWFTGKAVQEYDDEDDFDEDEYDDEEEDGDEDEDSEDEGSEEETSHQRPPIRQQDKPAECKQQ